VAAGRAERVPNAGDRNHIPERIPGFTCDLRTSLVTVSGFR